LTSSADGVGAFAEHGVVEEPVAGLGVVAAAVEAVVVGVAGGDGAEVFFAVEPGGEICGPSTTSGSCWIWWTAPSTSWRASTDAEWTVLRLACTGVGLLRSRRSAGPGDDRELVRSRRQLYAVEALDDDAVVAGADQADG